MEEGHRVAWIEALADGRARRKYSEAGDSLYARSCLEAKTARVGEYCYTVYGVPLSRAS